MTWFDFFTNRKLDLILQQQEQIMSALDDLSAEVGKIEVSIAAAIELIEQQGPSDSAALTALSQRLGAAQSSLDAAVAAHGTVTAPSS